MSCRKLHYPDQLQQLERVVQTRMRSAEQALNKELDSLRRIDEEIDVRRSKVDKLTNKLLHVQTFLAGDRDGEHQLVVADYTLDLNRRYWIDYDKQREEHYLQQTLDEHREQVLKVNEARWRVKSLQCKYDQLQAKIGTSRRQRAAATMRQVDAENLDSRFHVLRSGRYSS